MRKWSSRLLLLAASAILPAALLVAQPVSAITGDGTNFVNCNNRYTITTKYWGQARMSVYGCGNGYVYVYVTSSTTYAKGAGIKRDSPFAERYTATTGYSLYSTTTPMLVYRTATCYTATGWSMDSNYGATQSYRWCVR